jgi:hypothetical protein
MALLTLEGVYEDGRIALDELPARVRKSRVVVMFLPYDGENSEDAGTAASRGARQEAAARMVARMRRGIDFGGEKFDREELYEDTPSAPETGGVRYSNPFADVSRASLPTLRQWPAGPPRFRCNRPRRGPRGAG